MGKNKKAYNQNGHRIFTCKRCGKEVSERIQDWRKKPTAMKRVCSSCLYRDHIYQQTIREKREFAYHPFF
ncbi:MAG: hypothetical protein NC131_09955 [Roseburia sp.]|nr:hypothetical protein [Roseburia sp.]